MGSAREGDSAVGYSGDVVSHVSVDGKPQSPDQLSAETADLKKPARPPRRRRSFENLDRPAIVRHVIKNYDRDIQDRVDWSDMRIQRYAKLRGWMEPKDYPWPHASNAHIPLMMTDVLRTEDTLHNAVLTSRPVISAKAQEADDADKAENIDNLLDYQVFVENKGEERIGELINSFVADGTMVCYIPWVRDEQTTVELHTFPKPPDQVDFHQVALGLLTQVFPGKTAKPKYESNSFKWLVDDLDEEKRPYEIDVEFCTDEDDRLQLYCKRKINVFNGPCLIPKALEDVVVPSRSSNLQPPSPSNPNGAAHVILVDYPNIDEIKKLYENGYYDLLVEDDIGTIQAHHTSKRGTAADPEAAKVEKDSILGTTWGDSETARETFTRLVCFDQWDIDGDGLLEDVIFTIIKEAKVLCRARYTSEIFPANPPRRPFAEARYISVPGQFYGIGLVELMENLHDLIKIIFDQSVDAGTLGNTPWGLYKATSGIRPEVIRMYAGELYPTADPQNDINFPQMPNTQGTWGMNMVALLEQHMEKLTSLGDLQFGRVPAGKASALRTASTTQTILQQGDARPERILRRFFNGLTEIYTQMHELNKAFLPEGKQFRIAGVPEQGRNPYQMLQDPSQIQGRFDFSFKANVLNTDKAAHAQILQQLAGVSVNPMTIQTGIMTPEKMYNLMHDIYKANGQDPDRYLNAPQGASDLPPISAEQAVTMILHGVMPINHHPEEGYALHVEKLQAFHDSDLIGHFDQTQIKLFAQYFKACQDAALHEQQQQQLLQSAAQFAKQQGGNNQPMPQKPGGLPSGKAGAPAIQKNKLMNMSLPGAGGGGNPGGM